MKRKALVAMSGGVDSSVAAALMKEDGYDVTGVMLKLWKGEAVNNESGCCSLDAAEDARRVAQVLDIPFYVLNFADHFSRTVIDNFVSGYKEGQTPNPCVECNRSVKFSMLLDKATAFDSDVLATGHYARVRSNGGSSKLLRGLDASKDQSYVLYMLGQAELSRAAFPVGELSKAEVRQIAASLGLRTATKPESQEICFVPNGDVHSFLEDAVPAGSKPGRIVTEAGNEVGRHRGYAHYTVGQRRGLGVAVGVPLYVRHVDAKTNTVFVDEEIAPVSQVRISEPKFVTGSPPRQNVSVMTRYRGPEASARLEADREHWVINWEEPQPPAAPGQAAVFYLGEEVLGGGTIAA